jgi:hypothetical protein
MIFYYSLEQEYFSNKKQILMGYYADLEVEEVLLKETMKIERTAKKEPLEALQTTFTKRI